MFVKFIYTTKYFSLFQLKIILILWTKGKHFDIHAKITEKRRLQISTIFS